MIEALIILALTLIAGLLVATSILFYKLIVKVEKKDKLNIRVPIRQAILYDTVLYRLIYKLKNDIGASKVIVARFHNGGNFSNGFEMKKFTVTHETPFGSNAPLQDKSVGVFNSRYPEAILCLVTVGDYNIADINDCNDPNFKLDMKYYGFNATYLFLIKQFDGTEEGFVGVNYSHTHIMTAEQRDKVKEQIPRILGLVNMKEEDLKD